MATPSSSVTSPSPPLAYLHHIPGTQQSMQPNVSGTLERDQRKQAVDKFLARAEIAMVSTSSDLDASTLDVSLRCGRPSCHPYAELSESSGTLLTSHFSLNQ